jgi:hypothetical protein
LNWNYALLDPPPEDEQIVLISFEGRYHIASYNADQHVYVLETIPSIIFNPLRQAIFWCEISSPPDLSNYETR